MGGHRLGVVEDRLLGRDVAQMERKCVNFLVYVKQSAMAKLRSRGVRPGLTSAERERLKRGNARVSFALERENRELRRANEILRKASAYFAPPLGDCTAITCRATGRSSTADPRHDVVHPLAPRAIRGRADLQRAADRPIDVLRRQGPGDGPSPVAGAGAPRRGTARADPSRGEGELRCVRGAQGVAPARP